MQTVKKVVKFSGMEWNASVEQRVALAVRRRREVQRIRFEYNMTQFGLDHSSILALLESCDGILDEAKSVSLTVLPGQVSNNNKTLELYQLYLNSLHTTHSTAHRMTGQTQKAGGSKQANTNTGE